MSIVVTECSACNEVVYCSTQAPRTMCECGEHVSAEPPADALDDLDTLPGARD